MPTEPPDESWGEVATVVRSSCHDRTFVAHIADANWMETPAGPLNVVKAATIAHVRKSLAWTVLGLAGYNGRKPRWRVTLYLAVVGAITQFERDTITKAIDLAQAAEPTRRQPGRRPFDRATATAEFTKLMSFDKALFDDPDALAAEMVKRASDATTVAAATEALVPLTLAIIMGGEKAKLATGQAISRMEPEMRARFTTAFRGVGVTVPEYRREDPLGSNAAAPTDAPQDAPADEERLEPTPYTGRTEPSPFS